MEDLVEVHIEQREGDDVVVARLTGELDISGAAPTGQRIAEAVPSSARGVVVDMSRAGLHRLERDLDALRARPPSRQPPTAAARGRAGRQAGGARAGIVEFDRAAPVHADLDSAVAEIA